MTLLIMRVICDIYNDPKKSLQFGIAFAVAAIVLIVVGYVGNSRFYFCRFLGIPCVILAFTLFRRYRILRRPPQPSAVAQTIPQPPPSAQLPPSTQPQPSTQLPPYPATDQSQLQPSQYNASASPTNTGSTDMVSPLPYPPYPMSPGAPPPYPATGSWQVNPQSGHELPSPPSYDEAVKGSSNNGTS